MREDASGTIQFFRTSQLAFFLPDAVVPNPGLHTQVPEAGKITKQGTVTTTVTLYVRIPKGLMGWVVPSPHLARWRLTVGTAVLPGAGTAR